MAPTWLLGGCGPSCPSDGQGVLSGQITIDGQALEFDSVEVFVKHNERQGADNCVYAADLILTRGPRHEGCRVYLQTIPELDEQGRLRIDSVSVTRRDPYCPDWPVAPGHHAPHGPGPFSSVALAGKVEAGWVTVPRQSVSGMCYRGDLELTLPPVALSNEANAPTLAAEGVSIAVNRNSIGAPAVCPSPAP